MPLNINYPFILIFYFKNLCRSKVWVFRTLRFLMSIFLTALAFPNVRLQHTNPKFLQLFLDRAHVLLVLTPPCLRILFTAAPPYLPLLFKLSRMIVTTPVEVIFLTIVLATIDTQRLCHIIVLFCFDFIKFRLNSISLSLKVSDLLLK